MPKLQAGCTLTAQDGMVVHTARSSAKAAEGQNATLEFILVNHPLDCPVCDKGGECPLQDLTFRYGPGNTRFHLPKRTQPIEIGTSLRRTARTRSPSRCFTDCMATTSLNARRREQASTFGSAERLGAFRSTTGPEWRFPASSQGHRA